MWAPEFSAFSALWMAALLAGSLEAWLSSQCDGPPDHPLQGLWTLLCRLFVGPLVLRTARELGGHLVWCLVTQMTSGLLQHPQRAPSVMGLHASRDGPLPASQQLPPSRKFHLVWSLEGCLLLVLISGQCRCGEVSSRELPSILHIMGVSPETSC